MQGKVIGFNCFNSKGSDYVSINLVYDNSSKEGFYGLSSDKFMTIPSNVPFDNLKDLLNKEIVADCSFNQKGQAFCSRPIIVIK